MPPEIENGELEEDLGLTPVTTPVATDAPDTGDDAQPTSSAQDETKVDGPSTIAEAIELALAGPDKKEGEEDADKPADPKLATDPAVTTPEDKSTPAEEKADDDITEDELKGYQPRVQKRLRKLMTQRNEYRGQAEAATEDASHYRNIRSFMSESKLQDGEVAELFEVGRLLKSNDMAGYQKALDIVLPIAMNLLEATGQSLPNDIREKVENGELTEDTARELATQRSRATVAERRATEVQETVQTEQQTTAVRAHQTAVHAAVGEWEKAARQSDPDFGLKADAMRDAALALVAEKGRPKNPEEAVQFAKVAYERVSKWFRAARPASTPSRPAPSASQSGNRSGLSPAPKTLADAIKSAMKAGAN